MKVTKFKDYKGGWFVGNFEPTSHKTEDFEVCYKTHLKGEKWDKHYHKLGTEINYLIEGRMIIQGQELVSGDVFVIYPYEIADPEFLEDCTLVIIKTPSDTNDKYVVE
jgi:quercetin dioxygenase-like cupin family protein